VPCSPCLLAASIAHAWLRGRACHPSPPPPPPPPLLLLLPLLACRYEQIMFLRGTPMQ
jgi:hypothetical protein